MLFRKPYWRGAQQQVSLVVVHFGMTQTWKERHFYHVTDFEGEDIKQNNGAGGLFWNMISEFKIGQSWEQQM